MRCNKCQQIVSKPVQTQCCASLFCSQCAKRISSYNKGCIICHQKISFRSSKLSIKFMDLIFVKCQQGCDQIILIKNIRKHNQICLKRKINCKFCKNQIEVNNLYQHTYEHHQNDFNSILESVHQHDLQYEIKKQQNQSKISQIAGNVSPTIAGRVNQNKKQCFKGMNGKYNCKTKVKLKEGSFQCGTNSNCQKCMKLDIINLKLPKGYLINPKGYISKYEKKTQNCFCGRFLPLSRFSKTTAQCTALSPCPDCGVLKMLIQSGLYKQLIQEQLV